LEKNSSIIERVLDLAVQIQQIPAPTFMEEQRGNFIQINFNELGVNDVFMDDFGNVYARIKGRGEKPAVVVSAHLDTVFNQSIELPLVRKSEKISGPGIGDNSLGLAGLFGLYWAINESLGNSNTIPLLMGDLWLVANVCEEGLGDLKGMKAVVNRIGNGVMAYIILEGMSFGQIYHRGLGVRRYRISVHTNGGHSWVDYGNPSAIHELAEMVVQIKNLAMPAEPRTSLNVGMITGGTSVNTIASDASLELDLRSVNTQALNVLIGQVLSIVEEANRKGGDAMLVKEEVIGNRPAGEIPADHPLVKLAMECYARKETNVKLNIGSTDANEPLSKGIPAICVGLTTGGGAHTVGEYIDTQPLAQGLGILVDIIQTIFRRGIDKG
jgi:acetylornithine deacetylase/succinyl-diaminopimelate desuccinylase-like protein